ncbi:SMC-Scp complex subunit ScpB [Salisediminibacterium halotolerans]|uniref:SMC-Scp complex subunit ScpB n=1 Tax=Salisediminibacterium halotolerans TaxID=517425 RepID=UPI000EB05E23|nr:SMC-Scp complex subunit ScpB [Salisediminibacterium halotolerans]RLJ77994.1 segregation and condensation protein B [Actinophytocola xinjiangensis]RPE88668.1 segregation and condensation protein B [Salisediminibacterium halotolerans]TWG36971.1 segregation and condensation protein B [Salisediminibacterium halotolerans]GEL09101.1 segregation and condensation protein B [Salisediminibacterium halotolerans]
MQSHEIKAVIEGMLFVSGEEGIDEKQLMDVLQIDRKSLKFYIAELKSLYESSHRGIQLVETAGSYQLTTKQIHADYYKRLVQSPSSTTLSQAALECLAVVAYKQPIQRIEIEEIRGVKSERPLRTLAAKNLIKEVGRAEGTGRAILFGTTKDFLDQFGLSSLNELPPLPDTANDETIEEEADLFFQRFQQDVSQQHDEN